MTVGDLISRDWVLRRMILAPDADVVKMAPAADAVEIVRCKDCVCSGPLRDGAENFFQEHSLLCAMGRGNEVMGFSVVLPDDFCSDGIRADEVEE